MSAPQAVLVVDDDPDIREEIADLLAAAGHDVATAGDAGLLRADAFEAVDLVVLDLAMPKVDGVDLMRALARMERPPSVIVMSGHEESVLRSASRSAEAAGLTVRGILDKPVDPDRLLALCSAPCAARRASGEAQAARDILPALASAIETGTLGVSFQPKVTTEDLTFCGAEALLTNELPGVGRITPPEIIAAAARQPGMLVRLTHEVMRQASAACVEWTRAGAAGPVSVNLPIEALLCESGLAALLAIPREAGLAPEQVTMELIEDQLYDSSADVVAALTKLRIAGFGLALDDVGQRQSGLVQLANLPVTEIKIDQELTRQARHWQKARGIFASLATLGRHIGTAVVAEGVETAEDLALARTHEVGCIQGYLVSKKRPLNELLGMLRQPMTTSPTDSG